MQFYKPTARQELNPDTLTLRQLISYKGRDHHRLSTTFRNFKRAGRPIFYVTALTMLLARGHGHMISSMRISGDDNKGGSMLKLKTRNSNSDFDYSREFQRMNYLSEPDMKKESTTNLELSIKNQGGNVDVNRSMNDTRKKAPHYKYY